MSYAKELQYAVELARGAAKIIRSKYKHVERLTKTHATTTTNEAVTEADRASQKYIIEGLKRQYPDDGTVGEESDTGQSITFECPDPTGRVWVIDPIDGTNNFIAGLDHFAVCIGLLDRGQPVMGVVYDVMRDEMYAAAQGEGAWLNNQRLHAAATPMNKASLLMLTANLATHNGRCPGWAARWIGQTDWKVRMLGSAALEAVHVASGVAHAAITINGKLWDVAAAAALVLEAGGVLVNLAGQPIFPFDLRNYAGAKVPFIAAAPQAAEQILADVRNNP